MRTENAILGVDLTELEHEHAAMAADLARLKSAGNEFVPPQMSAAASGLPGSPLSPERAGRLHDCVYRLLVQLDPFNRDLTSLSHATREAWKVDVRARFARQHPDVPAARAGATPPHQLVTFLQPRRPPPVDRDVHVGGRTFFLRGGRLLGIRLDDPIVRETGVVQLEHSTHVLLVRTRDGGVWGTVNPPRTQVWTRWDWSSLTLSRVALGEAVDIVAAWRSAYAIDASGRIWGWGTQESTFFGIGNNASGKPAFADPTPVTRVWLENDYVPAPAFARISGDEHMLCAVARDGTLYTNGHMVVDVRTDEPYSEEFQSIFDDCVVEYRPRSFALGTGPLALLVDGSLFSLTAQGRVDLGGRVAVGMSVEGNLYAVCVHFLDGTESVLVGLGKSRQDEQHPGEIWVDAEWRA
mmetsp:Transcript_27471/g.87353  ORF Transcript_27471/g.87353 Transcript_27471/m.87353 type:complete len:410 (-) Transcript_27471:536-1765(-)